MNNANNILSMRDLSSPNLKENIIKLEDDVRNQEKKINDLKSILANKVDVNRVNGRVDLLEKNVNNLNNEIQSMKNLLNESSKGIPYENLNSNNSKNDEKEENKISYFSERNNIKDDKLNSNSSNIINENQINNYPNGYINNLIKGTELKGDGLEKNSYQKEIININNNKSIPYYSRENDIDKYDNKPSNTEKYKKNEEYSSKTFLDKNEFNDKKYLKKFINDDSSFEVPGEEEYDKINKDNIYQSENSSYEKDEDDKMIENIINKVKNDY